MTPGKSQKEQVFREDLKGLSAVQMYNQLGALSYRSLQPLPTRRAVPGRSNTRPDPGSGEDNPRADFRPILHVLRKSLYNSLRM